MSATPLDNAELIEEASACRRLWVAVLGRALLDAPRADAHGVAARAWLACPDTMVLDAAGLCPDAAVPALAATHRRMIR